MTRRPRLRTPSSSARSRNGRSIVVHERPAAEASWHPPFGGDSHGLPRPRKSEATWPPAIRRRPPNSVELKATSRFGWRPFVPPGPSSVLSRPPRRATFRPNEFRQRHVALRGNPPAWTQVQVATAQLGTRHASAANRQNSAPAMICVPPVGCALRRLLSTASRKSTRSDSPSAS